MPDLARIHRGNERIDKHRVVADLKDGRRVNWSMQTACANAGQIARWLLVPPSVDAAPIAVMGGWLPEGAPLTATPSEAPKQWLGSVK